MTDRVHTAVVSNTLRHLVERILTLKPEHAAKLRSRVFAHSEIARLRYVSAPDTEADRQRAADALAPRLEAAGGNVPGFYRKRGRWRMVFRPPGFFIPVRDAGGHIQALTQRVDEPCGGGKYIWLSSADKDGGASSGAPAHFAGYQLLISASEVTVVEGSLKADLAAYLSGAPVIGVAGTRATRGLAERLRTGYPLLRRVLVAYDRDMLVKPAVLDAAVDLGAQLEAEGFEVRVRTWPAQFKGLDDYLAAQIQTREVAA